MKIKIGLASWRIGNWKVKDIGNNFEKSIFLLCNDKKDSEQVVFID